jgi:hypothetical protein
MFYMNISKMPKNMVTKNDFAVLLLEEKPTIWMHRSILLKTL